MLIILYTTHYFVSAYLHVVATFTMCFLDLHVLRSNEIIDAGVVWVFDIIFVFDIIWVYIPCKDLHTWTKLL